MVDWNKTGWQVDNNIFVKTYLHKEKGVAIMAFWSRIRIAILNKADTETFSKMMTAPNYQFMEAFLLLKGDAKFSY